MDEKLYDLCDWGSIEGIIYADYTKPATILGPHVTPDGILINYFDPKVKEASVKTESGKIYPMELVEEEGFFAILIPGKRIPKYKIIAKTLDNAEMEVTDIYSFGQQTDSKALKKFAMGICYDAYKIMGSHVKEVNGVEGTLFTVWAPNALCVRLVGDFNQWDGTLHMMSDLEDSGVFELFVPGVFSGALYKYEIKLKGDVRVLKSDPYARVVQKLNGDASVVSDEAVYGWSDEIWINERKSANWESSPVSIYQVHLGSFLKNLKTAENQTYPNYKDLAHELSKYVLEMGYTHVEILPIMEYKDDASLGYFVTSYFAPTNRFGNALDLKYMIDHLHQNKIGVIMDWVPAFFADDKSALSDFDGTCLYDHLDPKKGIHPVYGTRMFNYARPQVSNFLLANAFYWMDEFHLDGLRITDVASMLYLDYGREQGQWVPNIYGDNINLEGVEFFKHLNSIHEKRKDGTMIIAEDTSSWGRTTDFVEDDGLGFQFKWNTEWTKDLMDYMKCDPLFRKGRHNQITLSMLYHYSEKFILEFSQQAVKDHGKSIIKNFPGNETQALANWKAVIGYMMTHPGKKLLFMGQDWADFKEWTGDEALDRELLHEPKHQSFQEFVKDCNQLYKKQPALYQKDYETDGFEWINDMDSERSILSFIRKTDKVEETLLVVCNFTPVVYEGYLVGVPYKGRYKEIFNSDSTQYLGAGYINPRLKNARPTEYDGRPFYINMTVPPMGISIFGFTPVTPTKEPVKKAVQKKTQSNSPSKAMENGKQKIQDNIKTKSETESNAKMKSFDKKKGKTKEHIMEKVTASHMDMENAKDKIENNPIDKTTDKILDKSKVTNKEKKVKTDYETNKTKRKTKAKTVDKVKTTDKVKEKTKENDNNSRPEDMTTKETPIQKNETKKTEETKTEIVVKVNMDSAYFKQRSVSGNEEETGN